MERYILCPGSFQTEKVTPPHLLLGSTSYSIHGTKLAHLVERLLRQGVDFTKPEHAAAADAEVAIVEPDETKRTGLLEEAQKMIAYTVEALSRVGIEFADKANIFLVEQRLWSTGKMWSGKPDIVVLNSSQKVLFVVDHKSGWMKVESPLNNHQIRANIALTAANYVEAFGFDGWKAYGVIVQPNVGSLHRDIGIFVGEQISKLISQYNTVTASISSPTPQPQKVSPKACHYCPARRNCDAIKQVFTDVATLKLKPTTYQEALDLVAVCKLVIKDYEQGAREVLDKDPNAIPGWTLQPGNKVTKITSPGLAYNAVKDFVKADQFLACCKVGITELAKVYGKASGVKASAAKDALMARIAPFTETKQNQPSIKRADLTAIEEDSE